MKLASAIVVVSLLSLTSAPVVRAAAPFDAYADAVYAASSATYAPENAVGAPDGLYADFRDQLASVTLDMGEGEEGTGGLALAVYLLDFNASWRVDFLDADMNALQTSQGGFELYATSLDVPYELSSPYRYVKVSCPDNELWRLDAVESASVADAAEDEAMPSDDEQTVEEPEADDEESVPPRGLLVRLVDDGDASTTVDSAVYVVGADGKRHAFPSELVYKTWFQDYDDVAFIDPENLAKYELGGNVTVRPGTWLVKITTDPKVYAVEPGGILRWVTTEEIAVSLWGSNWNEQVVDVPDTFWGNYTVGEPITVEKHPSGTLAITSAGEVVYLAADAYYSIAGDTLEYMNFDTDFETVVSDEKLASYESGGLLPEDPSIAYPY
jgi:hypothetical protein